jgi:hypothetical protein
MLAIPLVFIVIYPFVYLLLPETMARLADLPRDVGVLLGVEAIFAPVCGIWLYFKARHQASKTELTESCDTRDIL